MFLNKISWRIWAWIWVCNACKVFSRTLKVDRCLSCNNTVMFHRSVIWAKVCSYIVLLCTHYYSSWFCCKESFKWLLFTTYIYYDLKARFIFNKSSLLLKTGSSSPVENVVKKLGILGSSPYQLPQSGILGALPGLTQQQQQINGISHALNAG